MHADRVFPSRPLSALCLYDIQNRSSHFGGSFCECVCGGGEYFLSSVLILCRLGSFFPRSPVWFNLVLLLSCFFSSIFALFCCNLLRLAVLRLNSLPPPHPPSPAFFGGGVRRGGGFFVCLRRYRWRDILSGAGVLSLPSSPKRDAFFALFLILNNF